MSTNLKFVVLCCNLPTLKISCNENLPKFWEAILQKKYYAVITWNIKEQTSFFFQWATLRLWANPFTPLSSVVLVSNRWNVVELWCWNGFLSALQPSECVSPFIRRGEELCLSMGVSGVTALGGGAARSGSSSSPLGRWGRCERLRVLVPTWYCRYSCKCSLER